MKIGVLTFLDVNNSGSCLQAIATRDAVAAEMPSSRVELIDVGFELSSPGPVRWLLGRGRLLDFPLVRAARRRRRINVELLNSLPRSPSHVASSNHNAIAFIAAQGYDSVIVGSDEVIRHEPASPFCKTGGVPFSWLTGLTTPRVLLAASVGCSRWSSLDPPRRKEIRHSLRSFAHKSVRDDQSVEYVQRIDPGSASSVRRLPDPTVTLGENRIGRGDSLPSWLTRPRSPLLGFRMPDDPRTREFLDLMSQARYRPVSLFTPMDGIPWLYPWVALNDYPRMFRHLDFVVTSSFHSCLFALRAGVPPLGVDFASHRVSTDTGHSKLKTLLADFGLHQHYLDARDPTRPPSELARRVIELRDQFDAEGVRRRYAQLAAEYRLGVHEAGDAIRGERSRPTALTPSLK